VPEAQGGRRRNDARYNCIVHRKRADFGAQSPRSRRTTDRSRMPVEQRLAKPPNTTRNNKQKHEQTKKRNEQEKNGKKQLPTQKNVFIRTLGVASACGNRAWPRFPPRVRDFVNAPRTGRKQRPQNLIGARGETLSASVAATTLLSRPARPAHRAAKPCGRELGRERDACALAISFLPRRGRCTPYGELWRHRRLTSGTAAPGGRSSCPPLGRGPRQVAACWYTS
jgi:hypothetical protein